jgi:ABC-type Fe3+-hydroxamate transport system substrate-binding protein
VEPLFVDEGINLERAVALKPDLMVGQVNYVEAQYDELSQISPTVACEVNLTEPYAGLRFVGRVLGMEEEAEEIVTGIEGRIERAADRLGNLGTVSLASIFEGGSLAIYNDRSWLGQTVAELGGEVVPDRREFGVEVDEGYRSLVSAEQLPDLSGDSLVLAQLDAEEEEQAFTDAQDNPLYRNLPAVRNGRVLVVDRLRVFGTGGPRGYEAALDRIIEFFSGDE